MATGANQDTLPVSYRDLARENAALRGALRLAMTLLWRLKEGKKVDPSVVLESLSRLRSAPAEAGPQIRWKLRRISRVE